MASIAIGLGAGSLCYLAVRYRAKVGLDDSLDVVGVHGVGGAWGALATGLFAAAAYGGVDGVFFGNAEQFGRQLIAVGATVAYSGGMTFVILKVLDVVMGLRVSEEDELVGLDASQHGERAYVLDGGAPYAGIPVQPEPTPVMSSAPSTANPASAQS
jgi:Amt family ammonium transporter